MNEIPSAMLGPHFVGGGKIGTIEKPCPMPGKGGLRALQLAHAVIRGVETGRREEVPA